VNVFEFFFCIFFSVSAFSALIEFLLSVNQPSRPKGQHIYREREHCNPPKSHAARLRQFPDRSEAARHGRSASLQNFGLAWSDRWSRKCMSARHNLLGKQLTALLFARRVSDNGNGRLTTDSGKRTTDNESGNRKRTADKLKRGKLKADA
jgi:hypothetical protein